MMNVETALIGKRLDPQRSAIMLAMTEDMEAEQLLREYWQNRGQKCAVTMIGGTSAMIKEKLSGAVIGACINNGLIIKSPENTHPVLHALLEAVRAAKLSAELNQNYQLKIAIVRQGCWIAVALYGKMGFHEVSDHKTIGCGVHIIP